MNSTNTDEQKSGPALASPVLYEDEAGTTALYFHTGGLQSQMRQDAPDELVLPYTRTMTSFMLLARHPRHILMIGLGGGSIPKWCYRNLPDTDITIVEIDPQVIALRERFRIPADDHRFRILCEEGSHYIASTTGQPDILIIDGFNAQGQPPELCSQSFYDNCHRILTPDGLLVANLCDPNDHLHLARIRKSFQNRVLVIPFEDGENKIVFAALEDQTLKRVTSDRQQDSQ